MLKVLDSYKPANITVNPRYNGGDSFMAILNELVQCGSTLEDSGYYTNNK